MNAGLNNGVKQSLLLLARNSVMEKLTAQPCDVILPAGIAEEPTATFVTLTSGGQLRGCIGTLEAHQSLYQDIRQNACSAAFNDPRFLPVTIDEMSDLRFEISILTSAKKVSFDSQAELFANVEPMRDGVIIESGIHRATFLPQVWAQLQAPEDFFTHLKRKAGLSETVPLDSLIVKTYQVIKFKEPD